MKKFQNGFDAKIRMKDHSGISPNLSVNTYSNSDKSSIQLENYVNNVADKVWEANAAAFSAIGKGESRSIKDGSFYNPVLLTGTCDPNFDAGQYDMDMITFKRELIISIYHGSWIFRRVIDKVSQDMWANGITVTSDMDPQGLTRVYKRLGKTRSDLIYATEQARLFGGAAAIIMVDDGEDDLSKPLRLSNIKKGATIRLKVTDRWTGIEPSMEVVTNFKNPDYGLPRYYNFYVDAVNGIPIGDESFIKVHHSRVLRFVNRRAPRLIEQRLMGWGISELEHMYQDLMGHENAKALSLSLLNKAVLEIVKVKGMRSLMTGIAAGNTQNQSVLAGQLTAINQFRTSNSLVLLDSEDDYSREMSQFTGISDILSQQKSFIAGAAEMPQVLLYGDTKGGLTSDSPAEMEFYAGTILGKQEEMLRPVIDRLLPIIIRAEGMEVPKDLDYEFNTILSTKQENKQSTLQSIISSISSLLNDGLITHETALEEIKQIQKITGFGSNIEQRDVDLAKAADQQEAEGGNEAETVTDESLNDLQDKLDEVSYEDAKKKSIRLFDKFRRK